ncbi:MAG: glycosyltransferase family 2 protein [Gammaproteobacteria bacterium]|nr:glycosyltransferase family 2 protein [Gammaproteobacteria bacterium]
MKNAILLSICIPTFNRAAYLSLCLSQLAIQLPEFDGLVELSVYDNNSNDKTKQIVAGFIANGLKLKYYRNPKNIGSDKNIAQCYDRSCGQYVLVFGDDDVLTDGSLSRIINAIKQGRSKYGAIYIRAYGFNNDPKNEKPFQFLKSDLEVYDADHFFKQVSTNIAFTSSLVINKSKIPDLYANQFIGSSLVQIYVLYKAVTNAEKSLIIDEYLVAAKRIENRDYDVTDVFSESLNIALSYFVARGLSESTQKNINRKLLWYFYPQFFLTLRCNKEVKACLNESRIKMRARYKYEPLYWLCVYPMLHAPKMIVGFWAVTLIVISRLITGEFGRLYAALKSKMSPNGR